MYTKIDGSGVTCTHEYVHTVLSLTFRNTLKFTETVTESDQNVYKFRYPPPDLGGKVTFHLVPTRGYLSTIKTIVIFLWFSENTFIYSQLEPREMYRLEVCQDGHYLSSKLQLLGNFAR